MSSWVADLFVGYNYCLVDRFYVFLIEKFRFYRYFFCPCRNDSVFFGFFASRASRVFSTLGAHFDAG